LAPFEASTPTNQRLIKHWGVRFSGFTYRGGYGQIEHYCNAGKFIKKKKKEKKKRKEKEKKRKRGLTEGTIETKIYKTIKQHYNNNSIGPFLSGLIKEIIKTIKHSTEK